MASPSSILINLPPQVYHHEETPNAALLSNPPSSSSPLRNPKSLTFSSLIIISSLSIALAFHLISTPFSHSSLKSPHLTNLTHPAVIILSFDGFRFGYHLKTSTPNIHRLMAEGTSADEGLIPVFPSLTFPNHYSIATGLFPTYHGIINNYFPDRENPSDWFSPSNHDPKWWLGEPLWQTVARRGFNAAGYFWAGTEVRKGSWTCPPKFCPKYNSSTPFFERIDDILGYFDLPEEEIPILSMVYFQDPDSEGHIYGPDHPEITKAVAHVDSVVGRLITGLEKRGIFEEVTIILLSDHGMAGICDEKYVFLNELAPWIEIDKNWINSAESLLTIQPPPGVSSAEIVQKMNKGLSSGKVGNGNMLRVYLKEDLPERFHYAESNRIPPIIGVVEEGYTVKYEREKRYPCGGSHGYDNLLLSMRTFFVAHGPRFARGKMIPSFQNIEVYNLVTAILNLNGAPNNGSVSFANSVLLKK
ncbi:venom phosphodiesterase 2-like [Phalaenopsis equestris]|uniref:venom phosphodiesterase 2-like n=1 Tax=Phalaenopsis equestris TaxID=78828 RepID=UPI0009E5E368|nr:venom phosphodiesterase 2-like [Phalaenopsis equestris]